MKLYETVNHGKIICLQLTEELLKRETLNYDDVVKLLGPPLHPGKKLIEPFEFEMSLKQAAGPEPKNIDKPSDSREESAEENQ